MKENLKSEQHADVIFIIRIETVNLILSPRNISSV